MDIKELRIGNIVKIDDEYLGPIEGKVTSLNEKAEVELLLSVNKGNIRYFRCGSDDTFPILVTEELLLKNGFTDNGKGQFYYHLKDNGMTTIRCATNDYKNWLVMVDSMRYEDFISTDVSHHNVQYIHELQNVIQMAKVDKEIKL